MLLVLGAAIKRMRLFSLVAFRTDQVDCQAAIRHVLHADIAKAVGGWVAFGSEL